jgi:DNA repair protein RadC
MLPRERYLLTGPEGSGPTDLVALVLGTGAGGRSARSIADDLLDRFGGVQGLASAPPAALAAVRGVGPARATRLHAGLALGQIARSNARRSVGSVTTGREAAEWFMPALDGLDHEELHGLYLDVRCRPLTYRRLSVGSDRCTVFDNRQILRVAVEVSAHSLLIGHNHPSGDTDPSPEDLRATRNLAAACELLGVKLVDHLIIGAGDWMSLRGAGHLP